MRCPVRHASSQVRRLGIPAATPWRGYVLDMRTTCVRPGCGGSAAAVVLMDRDQQVVVVHPPQVGGPGAIALCAKHVDRVTTPAGWEVRDLRAALDAALEIAPEPPELITAAATVTVIATKRRPTTADPDVSLRVDDGATPMLGRAFRAASPGELRRPGEARGFAWLERGLDAELAASAGGALDAALGE